MGDDYWKPDIIATTWNQAETGRIPVSGAGYRGPFSGPGFDSIWTDMSEIVRPTRDGIHGREYITTSVDIGPKPMRLVFAPDGELGVETAPLLEIPIPAILDIPPWAPPSEAILEREDRGGGSSGNADRRAPERCRRGGAETSISSLVPLFEGPEFAEHESLLQAGPHGRARGRARHALARRTSCARSTPTSLSAPASGSSPTATERVWALYQGGIKVFHLCAEPTGARSAPSARAFVKDALREVHGRLVKEGVRDEVTLIVSGGIALAEHMAKAIICGADLVAVGAPLLVALGCRVCPGGITTGRVRRTSRASTPPYAAQRMVNLMGAWHSQLIEVLGAMGIREVRRLRGEVGRAMFLEDIEREAFGDLGG